MSNRKKNKKISLFNLHLECRKLSLEIRKISLSNRKCSSDKITFNQLVYCHYLSENQKPVYRSINVFRWMLLSSALKKKQYCFATFFFFTQALPTAVGFWFLKQENYNYIRTEIIALLKHSNYSVQRKHQCLTKSPLRFYQKYSHHSIFKSWNKI